MNKWVPILCIIWVSALLTPLAYASSNSLSAEEANQLGSTHGSNLLIPTLNQQGLAMTVVDDPCSRAFIDYAAQSEGWCLEVGAAYGAATIQALKQGARMVANDLGSQHLEILTNNNTRRVQELLTNKAW